MVARCGTPAAHPTGLLGRAPFEKLRSNGTVRAERSDSGVDA
jgi:hypothetical protein